MISNIEEVHDQKQERTAKQQKTGDERKDGSDVASFMFDLSKPVAERLPPKEARDLKANSR